MSSLFPLLCFFVFISAVVSLCPPNRPAVSCFVDPCQVSKETCTLNCVASYCGGCFSHCQCRNNSDCSENEYCRESINPSVSICVPYKTIGEGCGGFVPPYFENRCAPGLQCQGSKLLVDGAGVCADPKAVSCTSGCPSGQYCSADGTCLAYGSCGTNQDCNTPHNRWFHVLCVGHAVCQNSRCSWICGANQMK
jgi:hypothetical protein